MSLNRNDLDQIHGALAEYQITGSPTLRAQLVDTFISFASITARRIAGERIAYMDMDIEDLTSVGIIGLLDAINTFELKEGAKFETYCVIKIRGAIIDAVRSYESSTRLKRLNRSRARRSAEDSSGADPSRDGLDGPPALPKSRPYIRKVSLDSPRRSAGPEEGLLKEALEDPKLLRPDEQLSQEEVKEIVVKHCTDVEKQVLLLYYFENMKLKDIGDILKITEGRVSQIRSGLLKKLRRRLSDRKDELLAYA